MEFIQSDEVLDRIVKSLGLKIDREEHERLVYELYQHIDYTRKASFRSGYKQGRFDEQIESER